MGYANADGPILVFLGSTLRLEEAQAVLDATYLQPAAQGDIILAAHAYHPRAMLLIDGQFEDRPAVRHKEILWAMAQGIVMIGAASMGALRAAELQPMGMVGVGLIYRWYRRWLLAPDDAVAVQSGPSGLGFLPLTDALVDIERTASGLMRRGLVSPDERQRIAEAARKTNFRDRTLAAILRTAGLPEERISTLKTQPVRQKKMDAIEALRRAPSIVERRGRGVAVPPWTATNTFLRDLEASRIDIDLLRTY